MADDLRYFYDEMRHLVCTPFSVENLHRMAADLGIKRCWFHASPGHPHYDIPKRRIAEIAAKATKIAPREILVIMRGPRP